MTYERAKAIFEACRTTVPTIAAYERELEKAINTREVKQKLTSTYGRERVQGGVRVEGLDAILIEAESKIEFYRKKIRDCQEIQHKAEIIMQAMPKKYWRVVRAYYIKAWTVYDICKLKKWTSRTSVYKQLDGFDKALHKAFDK